MDQKSVNVLTKTILKIRNFLRHFGKISDIFTYNRSGNHGRSDVSEVSSTVTYYFSAKIEDYSMAPRATLHYDQIAIPSQPPNVTIPPNAVIDPSHLVPSSAPPHFSTTVTSTPQRVVSANPPQKKMVLSYEMENERKHAPEYVYSPGSSPEPSPAPSNDQKPDIIE